MTASAVALGALVIAGCGEVSNTITPDPGTANNVTVVISGSPNGFYVGLYEAQALGYFRASDMKVKIVPETGAANDPLSLVHGGQALVGITSTPTIFLHRNENQPLVGIAAIVHSPLQSIKISTAPATGGTGLATTTTGTVTNTTTVTSPPATSTTPTTATTPASTTATTPSRTSTTGTTGTTTTGTATTTAPTTTTATAPDSVLWPQTMQKLMSGPGVPTYDGLVIVARKGTIIDHAGLLRRFVQAVGRGYRAAKRNPTAAVANLVKAVPSLAPTEAQQLNTVNAALPDIFPTGLPIFGYQRQNEWNALGTWMHAHDLVSNPNTITDASTNELLQGEGV